jgi:hypothetical protein
MDEGWRTRVVETSCLDCLIRVVCFFGNEDPRSDYIDIQLISNAAQWGHTRWRNRLRNAWSVLRGRYDWSGFQLLTAEEARHFETAIREAIAETWPDPPRAATP